MDVAPYRLMTHWTACAFARHARKARVDWVALRCAWLTYSSAGDLRVMAGTLDLETLGCWIGRFRPLLEEVTVKKRDGRAQ